MTIRWWQGGHPSTCNWISCPCSAPSSPSRKKYAIRFKSSQQTIWVSLARLGDDPCGENYASGTCIPLAYRKLFFGFLVDLKIKFFRVLGQKSELVLFLRNFDIGLILIGGSLLFPRDLLLILARTHLGRLATADVAVLLGVLEQRALQHFATAVQTRHHRADGAIENLGDFLVGKPFDVGEQHNHLVVMRKRVESALDVLVHHVLEDL